MRSLRFFSTAAIVSSLLFTACAGQVEGDEEDDGAALASCVSLTAPVYQRVRTKDEAQLLTDSPSVANDFATQQGYDDGRGTMFLASKSAGTGLTPLYQVYNPRSDEHTWTTSAAEKASAMSRYGYTKDEGIAFYVSSTSATCLTPVYRYLSPASLSQARHRFALTDDDREALTRAGWTSEGLKFYVVTPGTASAPPGTAPVSTRPTGANTVRYEDLYKQGMTLQQVVNAAGSKLLTFPTGVFEFSNFNSGTKVGITLPSGSLGLAGSGRGTIFRMKAHTSTAKPPTAKGTTNPIYLFKISDCKSKPTFSNFQLQGTDQGHYYGGMEFHTCPGVTVSNLYLVGASPGYANSPPGETFGLNFFKSANAKLVDTEIDGRDTTGKRVCASPFGWNETTGADVEGGYFHHSKTGMPTFWMTTGVTTHNIRSEYNGTGSGSLSAHGINHERSSGIVHTNPTVLIDRQHGNSGMHFSFNNDQFNGTMTIINPTWDNGGIENGRLLITSGAGYSGGNQKQKSAPKVVDGKGKAIDFYWNH